MMNSRIKEIANEVSPEMLLRNAYCMESFAKSIIQECITVAESQWRGSGDTEHNHAIDQVIYNIKSHFGVE